MEKLYIARADLTRMARSLAHDRLVELLAEQEAKP